MIRLTTAIVMLFVAAACGNDSSPADPGSADPGYWRLQSDAVLGPDETAVPIEVKRAGCNIGETGEVLDPIVEYGDFDIIISARVERVESPYDAPCPDNDPVPLVVKLSEPIGDRMLFDGQCQGSEAHWHEACLTAVRWPIPVEQGPTWSAVDTPGAAAIWFLAEDTVLTADTTELTMMVTRAACSGGVTGEVYSPAVVYGHRSITISARVEPLPYGFYTCPGNDSVPYTIQLDEPIGDRELVDGECSISMRRTSDCETGVRWPLH